MNPVTSLSRRLRRTPRGGSLLEAFIALAVMAFGLSGFTVAMIASAQVDRRNNARASAKAVANELAGEISTWQFSDPRLAPGGHTGTNFSEPKATGGLVVQGKRPPEVTVATPSTITGETLTPTANFDDSKLALGSYRCRTLATLNAEDPGITYVFNRFWNVVLDPANPGLKIVAVHVTFGQTPGRRDVVTTYTSVMDQALLANSAFSGN